MMQPTRAEIEAACDIVHAVIPPTPQYCWPLLCERLGTEAWVKHENHTPVGAFKVRGGLVYFEQLTRASRRPAGVIAATRGNHGQSIAFAARRHGLHATLVVPNGNSREKNGAMRALGADLVEHGDDFQAALEKASVLAKERSLHMIPSFHPALVAGVATYAWELLRAVTGIDVAYVPIGLGSGICGMAAARDALGLKTRLVGVVSAHAPAYARSFAARAPIDCPVSTEIADGIACRRPDPEALEIIWRSVDRIVEVTDGEVMEAMRLLFECTHNLAEGAGAAALAAALQERDRLGGCRVAVILSGGNVDRPLFARLLQAEAH